MKRNFDGYTYDTADHRVIYGFLCKINEKGYVTKTVNGEEPYRWNKSLRCWVNECGCCKPETIRKGLNDGSYEFK